jgi:hypothetical protein
MLIDIHHRNAPRSVLQDSTGLSDLHTRSVRRASGFVLAGYTSATTLICSEVHVALNALPRGCKKYARVLLAVLLSVHERVRLG